MVTEKMGLSMMYLAFRGMIPIVAFRSESQSAFEMNEELKRWTSKIPPIAIKYILRIKNHHSSVISRIGFHPRTSEIRIFLSFYRPSRPRRVDICVPNSFLSVDAYPGPERCNVCIQTNANPPRVQ